MNLLVVRLLSFFFFFSSPAFPRGLRGQQLQIKPPHLSISQHRLYFAWIKSQSVLFLLLTIVVKEIYTKLLNAEYAFLATNAQYGKTESFEGGSKSYQQNINKHKVSPKIVEICTKQDSS